jgi:hypothetical protein
VKPKTKNFCLFRCFEHISKQLKQTKLFRSKPKQTETTLNFQKNTKICSLSNYFGWSSVCFGSIETLCFGIEPKQPKQMFVLDSAETSFGSSFGCFESKLVSKDTLPYLQAKINDTARSLGMMDPKMVKVWAPFTRRHQLDNSEICNYNLGGKSAFLQMVEKFTPDLIFKFRKKKFVKA